MTARRRMVGVLAGLVLGGLTAGTGAAYADGIVWGCPSGFSLAGATCRAADGSVVERLGMLPGDVDPVTGRVLLPAVPLPTTPAPTTAPAPTTTVRPLPTTVPPGPIPPAPGPCSRPATRPGAASAELERTAAALAVARERLATDTRRGAPPAVLRADTQALATAMRDHNAALLASRLPTVCPTR